MQNTGLQTQLAEVIGPECISSPLPLRRLFANAAREHPDNTALTSLHQACMPALEKESKNATQGLVWTYKQLDESADLLAAALYVRGVRKGMRVAAFLFNSAEWALLFWSSLKLGAIFVPLDARSVSRREEVQHYMKVVVPAVLVVGDRRAAEILQRDNALDFPDSMLQLVAAPGQPIPDGWTSLHDILAETQASKNGVGRIEETETDTMMDVVLILFTSGISGLPKACPHTNMTLWTSYQAWSLVRPFGPEDKVVQNLPPSHSFACIDMAQCWSDGAEIVYPAEAFDAKSTLEAIEILQCTYMSAIPGLFLALITHPSFTPQRIRSLRRLAFGGTVISPETLEAATDPKRFHVNEVGAGFGMSEVLPVFATDPNKPVKGHSGIIGFNKILTGARVKVCEPESRKLLRRREIGELHLGGNGVIDRYMYGDNETFYDEDNVHWISTGDRAMMGEDGTVYIMGRYKDIIIRGGENLSPALIENCLEKTGVRAQVIGIPDDMAGEIPVAIIQYLRPGGPPLDEMQTLVQATLGPQSAPVAYLSLQELGLPAFPTTTSGKVRKDQLKTTVMKHLSVQASERIEDTCIAVSKMNSNERLLVEAFAEVTGQLAENVSLDHPVANLTDSINILRLHLQIRKRTNKDITIEDVLRASSIRVLAQHLERLPCSNQGEQFVPSSKGPSPPTTTEMVHTQGEDSQALRTRLVTVPLLDRLGMSWSEVEEVFPVPDVSARCFEDTRPKAYSLRMSFVAQSASKSTLRAALEATLQKWPISRSIAVRLDQQALFVIMRAGSRWSEAAITEAADVEHPQDLVSLTLPDPERNSVHPRSGGPLTRFVIADIKSEGRAGLMILSHHSPFDAISLQAFSEDLQNNMAGRPTEELRASYKMFADMYYLYAKSLPSQIAVSFHVNRLRGISSLRESCWPRQRCVGWHIGDDEGYTVPTFANPTLLPKRTQIDSDRGDAGLVGLKGSVRLTGLGELRSRYNVSAPVLFKAACAILNSHLTLSPEVLFMNSQAGRQWPFLDPSIAKHLPNPVTIAGSTLASVLNRIQVQSQEALGSFLTRLEAEQQLLTAYAHAPTASITSQLNPGDVSAFMAGMRQLLNWNPVLAETVTKRSGDQIGGVRVLGYTEVMLEWHCGMFETDVAGVVVQWDGCQTGKIEVQGWLDKFMTALEWVANGEHWESKLEELVL